MNYYGLYIFVINAQFQPVSMLIGCEKATHPDAAIFNFLINNVPDEKRDSTKKILQTIEYTHSVFYSLKDSGFIEKNKRKLSIINFDK